MTKIILPTHDKVFFAGNEVILLKFDQVTEWNNAVVISTGDPNQYKVQRSIRRGIASNTTMTYFEVVHLCLEMVSMGAKLVTNLLFPGGFNECIRIAETEFERLAGCDEKFAIAKARIHSDWDSLTVTDSSGNETEIKRKPVAGITGVSHPTGN